MRNRRQMILAGLFPRWRARHFLALLSLGLAAVAVADEGEIRALWVDAWGDGFRSEAEVAKLLGDARSANINLIFPNLRRNTGEVFFKSSYEPMAAELEPGFDPLEALLRHARAAEPQVEIHPYIAVTPVWTRPGQTPEQPKHPFILYPEWLSETAQGNIFDRKYFFDFGHPGFTEHMAGMLQELVENYDIDGLQLDKIRYSGLEWGYNPLAVERFNALAGREGKPDMTDPLWGDFRRGLVTAMVRRVYLQTKAIRPETVVSAAAICWLPAPKSDDDWQSTAAYSKVLQNWHAWLEEGILDLAVPMTYFEEPRHLQGWEQWTKFIKDNRFGRPVVLGLGLYKNSIPVSIQQIEDAREPTPSGSHAQGVSLFSYRVPDANRGPVEPLLEALSKDGPFAEPASLPLFPEPFERNRGHLLVKILDEDGNALRDHALVLRGPTRTEKRTDGNGMLAVLNLAPGTYHISSQVSEFAEPEVALNIPIEPGKVNRFEALRNTNSE